MRTINMLIVHCSATPASMDVGVDEIRTWHTAKPPKGNGWADIGYHFVIRRDGKVEEGRDVTMIGAHAHGYNEHSIGICLVGGVDKPGGKAENNFTYLQMAALKSLLHSLKGEHPAAKILGHRDVNPGKECPSFSVRDWLVREGFPCNNWS